MRVKFNYLNFFVFSKGFCVGISTFLGGVRPHTTIFLSPHAPCDRRVEAKGEALAAESVLVLGYELE